MANKALFPIVALFMMMMGGLVTLFRILWVILTHPFTAFKKVPRNVPPGCLLDRSLGSHEYVTANGIKFHYVTAGDRSKPLMLFIHGFPEFWFSWRYQLTEFQKDYHVVAIDLRGYGETDRPPNKSDYTMGLLIQDVVELIPALGYSKCTLVGHDGGGIVAWQVVSQHPELVEKFIAMNCTHPRVYLKHAVSNFKQVLMSWYVFMFQWPKLPELWFSMRDYMAMEHLLRDKPMGLMKNRGNISNEDLEAYKYTISQPGAVTAFVNYYRAMSIQKRRNSNSKRDPFKKIQTPTLLIWGDQDAALHIDLAEKHTTVADNISIKHIPDCSHWVQQDAPDEVNQFMREFLKE